MGAEASWSKPSDDVGAALARPAGAEHGKTTVIEVMVHQELGDPFRRDASKKPLRLLDKYRHTNVA